MKLMFYFFSLSGSSGGAERMLFDVAAAMLQRGHDVRVVSWDPPSAQSFYPVPPRAHWHRLGDDASVGVASKLRRTVRLVRLLRRERPDLFVGFVMGADKSIYAANRIAGVPIAAAERNAPEMYRMRLSGPAASFYFALFGLCRGIAVQFESYRRGYPPHLHDRIEVIPNAVRTATTLAQPGRAAARHTLLSVGRLSQQKRCDVLIDAFASLAARFPDWSLRIVGEGPERAALEARVRERGLQDRVEMPGATAAVEDEYARAHAFVLASRWEGFPNALAEALAHGLPSVGFAACPGVNQLIVPGSNGLLAAGIDDANALATALAELMGSAESRRSMGERARASMAAYQGDAVYDRWESFFRRCAGASS
jgi:glycosyltransferase involved in cell wall biosynthesis